jgi:VWFA-related protein
MRRTLPVVAAILTCLLCFTSALGFSQAAGSTPANTTPTTIQVTSRIVNVDAVVRDKWGRIVHGLKPSDFLVEEDGKPQSILYFDEHTYDIDAASRIETQKRGESTNQFSNVPDKGAVAGSINIVLFDLFDTPASDQLYARRQLLKFLETMPSGQQVALFVLGQHLQMVQDFTGSSDRLIEAAKKIRPSDFHLVESAAESMQEADGAADLARAAGENMSGHALGGGSGEAAECLGNATIRASNVVATFNELARATNGYPGRKNLFWMSDCFPMALGSQVDATKFSGFTIIPGWRETANLVADSQIAVFPISLLGLQTGGIPASVNGVGEGNLLTGSGGTFARQFQQREAERAWVNDLAKETGGEAFFGTNDFAGAIRRGMGDDSNYYAIAYRPTNSNWNKHYRKISVKMLKGGYSIAYQGGYFAFPNELSTATSGPVQQLDAALQPESPESTLLLLRAKVDVPADGGAVVVHSLLDVDNLGLVNAANGHRQGQIVVRLIGFKDTPGNELDQPEAPPQETGVLNLDFDAMQYAMVAANGISFTQQLKLPPGRYRLRLGVDDVVNHRIGTLDMPITIPGPTLKN